MAHFLKKTVAIDYVQLDTVADQGKTHGQLLDEQIAAALDNPKRPGYVSSFELNFEESDWDALVRRYDSHPNFKSSKAK